MQIFFYCNTFFLKRNVAITRLICLYLKVKIYYTSTNLLIVYSDSNKKYFFATDYRAIVGTAVSTRFRLLSRSRRPDNQRSGISGRPTGPRERAESRREEERKNNWKFSDGQARGWDSGTPATEDVLAGRLAIKQRARAKYLHKSVLPCAARRGAYTTSTQIRWANAHANIASAM